MIFLFFGIAAAVFAFDLIFKAVLVGSSFKIIPGVLSVFWRSELNKGAAFSLFDGGGVWLVLFTVVILCIGLIVYFRLKNKDLLFNISCGLIFGGALGNLYDRIFLGGVRDFLKFDFISFPIFNFADACLNVGVALLVVWLLFFQRSKPNAT